MNSSEIGKALAQLCREQKFVEAAQTFYAEEIVSVEGEAGEQRETVGLPAVLKKMEWWGENFNTHGVEVSHPYVDGDQFSVVMKFDATNRASGERSVMDEVGVYTVQGGKIIHERFFYASV